MQVSNFQITPALTKVPIDIKASRQAVSSLPVTVPALISLRESARLVSTDYSTQIEGNRFTQEQVKDVLHGLVMGGKKKATPYRDGQNVIKDSGSGEYLCQCTD